MKLFKNNKTALAGMVMLALITICAILIPIFSSYSYFETHLELKNQLPSWQFLFGTDELGRDLFCRTFFGARISLSVGFIAALIDLAIGVLYGLTAAFFTGSIEESLMRFCDILNSIPYLLIVILLLVILNPGFLTIILALTITGWINMARIVKSRASQVLKADFILAAHALGASKSRIIFKHLLPNIFGTIIATMTLTIPTAIFAETFLSFLGLGIQAPIASWGVMLNDSLGALRYYPHRLFFPAFFLSLTLISLNLLGDGLREAFDPREKKA